MVGTNPFDDSFDESHPKGGKATVTKSSVEAWPAAPHPRSATVVPGRSPPNPFAYPEDNRFPLAPNDEDEGGINAMGPSSSSVADAAGGLGPSLRVPPSGEVQSSLWDQASTTTVTTSTTPPAEASWQYLGDLPYRRVPIYSHVRWERTSKTTSSSATIPSATSTNPTSNPATAQQQPTPPPQQPPSTPSLPDELVHPHGGLATFHPASLQRHPSLLLPARELRVLLKKTTWTKVVGCPHGGPIAVVTLPVAGAAATWFIRTEIRILTNAGRVLAQLEFPPPAWDPPASSSSSSTPLRRYTPAHILEMGFTSRTTLIVVLRDSLCLTYNLRGQVLLPPFWILPRTPSASAWAEGMLSPGAGEEIVAASVYDGGVAVMATNKDVALVELLDDHDDLEYLQSAHVSARRLDPSTSSSSAPLRYATAITGSEALPPHWALVSTLPTAAFAAAHFLSYVALAVLPRTLTSSRHPEIFLSTQDHSVVVVQAGTGHMVDVQCRSRLTAPIVTMTFAPNGRFLACFTESSMLTVISTSFETKVLDFDTSEGSSSPPLDMKWCGEDSVVLHWKNLGVLMVGPYGDWLRFPYQGMEKVYLIPEMDCCRVITDSSVEILQRVPPATAMLLRIGSIETAAMLLDASDAFDSGSPASDETARSIVKSGSLKEAIETCMEAAAREFDMHTQKRLLRAASYGITFSYKIGGGGEDDPTQLLGGPVTGSDDDSGIRPSATTVKFVDAARKLRILNALRNPNTGFLLTSAQFEAITPTGVVARLVAMRRPALACSISKYLSLPQAVQLYARAAKAASLVELNHGRSDSETAEAAIRIINEAMEGDTSTTNNKSPSSVLNRGGYATVAMAAIKAGRPGVANLLLMLESSVADKVPALLSTGSYADAMAVATGARDIDFIFITLMEYERSCMSNVSGNDLSKAQSAFLSAVVSKFTSEGFNTLRRYLETTADVKSVTNLLLRAQKFSDAGAAMAMKAMAEPDFREKQGLLTEASRIFGLGKETVFHKSCTDDYLELLKDQEVLRTKYGATEVAPEGTSVTETISAIIHFAAANVREQHRLLSDVEKIAKKFRIPEKRLWHIKVKAFADSNQWSNLRILADSRAKPPIGFKPFARAAIQGKQSVTEIMRYIDRITTPEERYELFCEAALWKRALEEAGKLKDGRRILNVKTWCNNTEVQLLADQMLGRLA